MAGIWRLRLAPGTRGPALLLTVLILLTTGLALSPPPASASPGWELILDRPSPSFRGMDFVSDDEGWLVAGAGLLHTTDGGATWQETAPLTGIDVDFADAAHGWLVGYNGTIYGTADGTTWREQTSGTSVHLLEVAALSPEEAWAVGSGEGFSDVPVLPAPSTLLHTVDGGATWEQVDTPPGSWFGEIAFVGDQGWALGSRCAEPLADSRCPGGVMGALLRTADGGETWSLLETSPTLARNLDVVDGEHGWASAYACIAAVECISNLYRTTDGGLTWQTTDMLSFGAVTAFDFRDPLTGWAVAKECDEGYQCALVLLSTEDGGVTWGSRPIGPGQGNTYVYSLLASEGTLYLTSGSTGTTSGLALRSTDDGASWQPMEHPALTLSQLSFVDRMVGYALNGEDLYRTEDAGVNWNRVGPAPGAARPRPLEFLSADRGFTAGEECTEATCVFTIYRTDDGGTTWAPVFSAPGDTNMSGMEVQFVDSENGWVVASSGFVVTHDGGVTWEQRQLGDLGAYVIDADLADADHAWAIVAADEPGALMHGLIRTRDGGRAWEAVPSGPGPGPELIEFVDRDYGWYTSIDCEAGCVTTIFATGDGGERWTELEARPRLAYTPDLVFVDRVNGWLNESRCDEAGCTFEVLHSPDGGRTWLPQISSDLAVATFEFVDAETGWLLLVPSYSLGIGGPPHRTLLYHTTDGGGGPIGRYEAPTPTIAFPDVGRGTAGAGPGAARLVLLLGAIGVSLTAAGLLSRLRRQS